MIAVGVVGVGSMGQHHARVYRELPDADLIGVYDVDTERAEAVAAEHGTVARPLDELLDACDAVSIVVPTRFHREITEAAIEADTDVLVEKPLAGSSEEARAIVTAAESAGVTLQVGHIERFNPAVKAVSAFASDLQLIALDTQRLGPPVERDGNDGVVMDLMIHDIDIARSLLDGDVIGIQATGTADGQYVAAALRFDTGIVATLTASRVTHKKVRQLTLTADDCRVDVDYTTQDVAITRQTLPEYVTTNGGLRYRSETVVERPTVDNGEPLKKELSSFVDCARTGAEPEVTGEDGVRALELAESIVDAIE